MFRKLCLTALLAMPGVALAQASTTVLWYHGNGGTTNDSNAFNSHVSNTLLGSVDFRPDWPDLSGYRFIVIARPTVAFDAAQVADLEAYLDAGGFVAIAGDSNAAGLPQITTINTLMTDLGRTAQLEDIQFTNPTDDTTFQPECRTGTVVNGGTIIGSSNPLSIQTCGDINPGSASIIEGYSITIEATQFAFDLVTEEDRVLLTSDFDFFSGNTCGLTAKQAFWTGMWTVVCDLDEDGATSVACGGFDCDDLDSGVGADVSYLDLDGDGFGDDQAPAPCEPTAVQIGGDCDDSDPDINPDADEVCDGIDNDCLGGIDDDVVAGGEWYADFDSDGFGREGDDPVISCEAPPNFVDVAGDCDDGNADVFPEATEVCNNGVDEDCDGNTDEGCSTFTPPPPETGGGGTCGCQSAGPSSVLGLLGGLGLLFSRRPGRR